MAPHLRTVIVGVPKSGKTTLSHTMSAPRFHTDDLIALGWSEASEAACNWLDAPGPWVIEGVAMARALRKWLAKYPEGKPCDQLVVLETPWVVLTKGQETMAKGIFTVLDEIIPELVARGVEICWNIPRDSSGAQ